MRTHDDSHRHSRKVAGTVPATQLTDTEADQQSTTIPVQDGTAIQTKAAYGGVAGIMMKQEEPASSAGPEEAPAASAPVDQAGEEAAEAGPGTEEEGQGAEAEEEEQGQAEAEEEAAPQEEQASASASSEEQGDGGSTVQMKPETIQLKEQPGLSSKGPIQAFGLKDLGSRISNSLKDTKYSVRSMMEMDVTKGEKKAWLRKIAQKKEMINTAEAKKRGVQELPAEVKKSFSIEDVYADKRMWGALSRFAAKEFSAENLEAFTFLRQNKGKGAALLVQEFASTFMGSGSKKEINLRADVVKAVQTALNENKPEADWAGVATRLQEAVTLNIMDTWQRFTLADEEKVTLNQAVNNTAIKAQTAITTSSSWKSGKYGLRRLFGMKVTQGEKAKWIDNQQSKSSKSGNKDKDKKSGGGVGAAAMFQDKRVWKAVRDFAITEFSVENFNCYEDIAALKASPSREAAEKLYLIYLKQGSLFELNLPKHFVQTVATALENKQTESDWRALFAPIQVEAEKNILDTFFRWSLAK